ncbi:MAG: T9SS type A sorting domain-containing protein [Saprospiraceae bacterium]|nr:T9SS type A sorting domain-containing protein [Saprospiraceae bacterium]
MKTLTTFLIFTFVFTSVSAQNLAVGTVWYYHQSALFGENGNYIKMQIVADSTINGKICKKFIGGFGCSKIAERGEFVYIENKKAYRYDFDRHRFWLLYDWSAKMGDTVTIYVPQPSVVDSFKIRIDSVTTWTPNGEQLIVQKTSRIGASRWIYASQQIIEKIGANAIFFPQSTNCNPIQFGSLRCFNEPSKLEVKFVNYKCDSIIVRASVSELLSQRQITLFPTPSVSELNISLDELIEDGFSIQIVNTLGQVIHQCQKFTNETVVKIDISAYQSGIYNVIFTDKNGGNLIRKFIKTE